MCSYNTKGDYFKLRKRGCNYALAETRKIFGEFLDFNAKLINPRLVLALGAFVSLVEYKTFGNADMEKVFMFVEEFHAEFEKMYFIENTCKYDISDSDKGSDSKIGSNNKDKEMDNAKGVKVGGKKKF